MILFILNFFLKFLLKFFSLVIFHHFSHWSLFFSSFCPSLGAFVPFFFSLFSPFFFYLSISMFLFLSFPLSRVSLSFFSIAVFASFLFVLTRVFLFSLLFLISFFFSCFFTNFSSSLHLILVAKNIHFFMNLCLSFWNPAFICGESLVFFLLVFLICCVSWYYFSWFSFINLLFLGLFKNCRLVFFFFWKITKISLILPFLVFKKKTPCFSSFCDQFFL